MAASTIFYDSGSVAAGAVINSDVFNFNNWRAGAPSAVQVLIDNSAGDAFRKLTLTSYLDDGTTEVDSVVLRYVAFGAAPTGGHYVTGKARVYVGPNPPGTTSGIHLLCEQTSAANSDITTDAVLAEDLDQVLVALRWSAGLGGAVAGNTLHYQDDDAAGVGNLHVTGLGNAAYQDVMYEAGPGLATATTSGAVAGQALPRRIKFLAKAAGAAITTRVRIYGRGRPPGTSSVQMVLPTRFKLTLAAAGTGAARMVVYGA